MEDFEIITIYPNCLWAIKRPKRKEDEYVLTFRAWHDIESLTDLFRLNKDYIGHDIWTKAGLNADNPELSVQKVIDEANELEVFLKKLCRNSVKGTHPNLDDHFKPLGRDRYSYQQELEPQKSYGTQRPSLLRLYAIKLGSNQYLIVVGAIKLGASIQTSPGLHPFVFNRIDEALTYLKQNGICESEDI